MLWRSPARNLPETRVAKPYRSPGNRLGKIAQVRVSTATELAPEIFCEEMRTSLTPLQ